MFSGSSNSFLLSSLFRSKRAESRLWQRGCSSLGGFRASCFSRSAALGRWLGFLSRAASISSRRPGLQSSAMSSKGGACLWIYQQTSPLSTKEIKIPLTEKSIPITRPGKSLVSHLMPCGKYTSYVHTLKQVSLEFPKDTELNPTFGLVQSDTRKVWINSHSFIAEQWPMGHCAVMGMYLLLISH